MEMASAFFISDTTDILIHLFIRYSSQGRTHVLTGGFLRLRVLISIKNLTTGLYRG
jgi:hypothetical protein